MSEQERDMKSSQIGKLLLRSESIQKVFSDQVLLGGTCLKLFFASIFYFLLSVLNVENMQPGWGGWKFKSNNWLNLWREDTTYIYLVIALLQGGRLSNTLQVCTIHSMWKSQKFLKTIKHWRFILRPHLPLLISIIYDIFLDKYTLLYDLYYTLVLNTIDPSECPSYDIASVTS